MPCVGGSGRRCCSNGRGRRSAAAPSWKLLEALAAGRQFAFAAERATFLTVLHRLFVSGSDRAADKWRADYRIDGTEGLRLQHLYRIMAWLGEPLADQTGASELAPRCRKDLVEEKLFARRRDLFAEIMRFSRVTHLREGVRLTLTVSTGQSNEASESKPPPDWNRSNTSTRWRSVRPPKSVRRRQSCSSQIQKLLRQ
jgi:hypothetical protein